MDFIVKFCEKGLEVMLTNVEPCDMINQWKNKEYILKNEKEQRNVQREMNIKLITNYLVGLFFGTKFEGKNIACTRTKIGKLLTIVQLLFIKKYHSPAFVEEIFDDKCGTSIPALSAYGYPYNILNDGTICRNDNCNEYYECNLKLDLSKSTYENLEIPEMYRLQDEELNEETKNIVHDVFVEFGGYGSLELGKLIDEIKKYICSEGKVDLNNVEQYINSEIEDKENLILNFIKQYE